MYAQAQITITDFNDLTPSNTAPVKPYKGQIWQDTSQTPPILKAWDGTQWIVVNDYEIGARNLLLKSNAAVTNTAYPIKTYLFGDEKPIEGETYTFTMKGRLGSGKTNFSIYNSGGNVLLAPLNDYGNGLYGATFKWTIKSGAYTAANTSIFLYPMPKGANVTNTVEWAKLERGNKATDWTPAPEDIDDAINNVEEVTKTNSTNIEAANGQIKTLITENTTRKGETKALDTKYSQMEQTVDGLAITLSSTNTYVEAVKKNYGYPYAVNVIVYGDSDKYYPVIIKGGNQNIMRNILVARGYQEKAPDDWNTATHKGYLALHLKCNFGAWGGAQYTWEIHDLNEAYCHMFAGAKVCGLSGTCFAIFLRGGGETGALYHLYSDQALTGHIYDKLEDGTLLPSPHICYDSDLCQITGKTKAYAPSPRDRSEEDIAEINSHLYVQLAKNANKQANENLQQITAVKTKQTTFEATLDGITSTVSQTEQLLGKTATAVASLSSTVTQQADKWTAAFKVIGAEGYAKTGKTTIDANGLTIYDGALTVKNAAGVDVLKANQNGYLDMSGTFTQYADNGYKSIGITDNAINIYAYSKNAEGSYDGAIELGGIAGRITPLYYGRHDYAKTNYGLHITSPGTIMIGDGPMSGDGCVIISKNGVDIYGAGESFYNNIYPIGCVYTSTDPTNPALLFGGTWELIEGRTLMGVDKNDTDFSYAGKTGGSKTVKLSEAQLGYHDYGLAGAPGSLIGAHEHNYAFADVPILSPYYCVYIWHRVA